jgi:hypothetical protein
MSETPKKKTATKKAVSEHGSAYNKPAKTANTTPKKAVPAKPAKKAAVKKATAKKVVDAVDAVVALGESNPDLFKETVETIDPSVTDSQVAEVLTKAPGFWAKIKQFLLGA